MDIRQLQYLAALARERHFTRAAAACNVTQPTLSGRIRQLEQELGVPVVERGQRFHDLTPEGKRVLGWALKILENCDNLKDELALTRGAPSGRVALGVIPSALPTLPPLTGVVHGRFPGLGFSVASMSSEEIRQQLEEFSIDAGVTYLDNEPIDRAVVRPLYRERYRLFVRLDHPLAERRRVSWSEAAEHPLCALTPNMQNRRIVDAAFLRADCRPTPEVESSSIMNLCAYVRVGGLASVLPELFVGMIGDDGIRAIPLVEPTVEHTVGLVTLDRDPLPLVVEALLEAATAYRLPGELTARL
ncbi:DNA-binding transcriptional regulator, LysR family [Tistlia consotensis]|uniref:DNA-binding transcriptional regulator, LysR family n=1 Tax=Tistlia consotensis USBA 355 TaxID=560819 RepID=A0A1Y6B6W7_9PROT|nr:LysR family transcriptional regulator [Tistlia consotensis]SME88366.1 DNA-binding transcriptional regulator, LysR family [Tistlia consotensis USBA 355]SNR24826.1 DNA-binding transcriptional regulator, LysR family [Tistlia consotensis]